MATETSATPDRLAPPAVSSREAHYALAVLTIISALNYADRGLLSLLLDPVKRICISRTPPSD